MVDYDLVVQSDTSGFIQVGDVARLAGGEIAVLDRGRAEVLVFSELGRLETIAGRRGSGPGELSGGTSLALIATPAGGFAVPDIGNGVVATFSSAGEVLDSRRFPGEVIPQWRDVGDRIAVLVGHRDHRIQVMDTLGGIRHTLAEFAQGAWSQMDERWPLLPDHVTWDVGRDDRVATGRLSRPEFQIDHRGLKQRIVRWETPNRRLSSAQVDTLLSIAARLLGDPAGNPERSRDRMAIPENAPALGGVLIGGDFVLVQEARAVSAMDERIMSTFGARGWGGQEWYLFKVEGDFVGRVDFGQPVEVYRFDGTTLVGVREDALGRFEPFVASIAPPEAPEG